MNITTSPNSKRTFYQTVSGTFSLHQTVSEHYFFTRQQMHIFSSPDSKWTFSLPKTVSEHFLFMRQQWAFSHWLFLNKTMQQNDITKYLWILFKKLGCCFFKLIIKKNNLLHLVPLMFRRSVFNSNGDRALWLYLMIIGFELVWMYERVTNGQMPSEHC